MNRRSVCAALGLTLVLLAGCASKTSAELARADGTEEAVPTVEALEFAPREAYHLAEIEVQSVEDGAVLTVDGVCELSVKGFGCGKTITADGKTCAGAKTGETLVWLTCDYTNLTENEVSPGRLLESGLLRYESGSAEGKSASFAKLLPGRTAEVYFYYAIPESLAESPLTLQFTIGGQTYSYELPTDRTGALTPSLPEPEEPEKEPKEEPEQEPITLQEPPKQEYPAQQEQPKTEKPKQEPSAPAQQEKSKQEEKQTEPQSETPVEETAATPQRENFPGGYFIHEYDAAGRKVKSTQYRDSGELVLYYLYEYDAAGRLSKETSYTPDWQVFTTDYYENGLHIKYEYADGSGYEFVHDANGQLIERITLKAGGVVWKTEFFGNGNG